MEKRTIIAIGLSVLVFIAFQWYQQRYMTPPPGTRAAQSQGVTQPQQPASQQQSALPEKSSPAEAPGHKPAAASATDAKATPQKVVIEGDLYRAVVDNKGGVLTSWELKKFKSAQGRVFEMIAASHDSSARPFLSTLELSDPALKASANNELYEVTVEGAQGSGSVLVPPITVDLKLRRGDFFVQKRYHFEKDNYILDLSTSVEKGGKPLDGRFLLGQDIGPEQEHLMSAAKLQAVYYSGGKDRREAPPKDENEIKKIGSDVRWAGLDMHYFAMIAIPAEPFPYFDIQKRAVKAIGLDGKEIDRELLRLTIPIPASGSLKSLMYIGPKKQSNLEAIKAANITGVIDYGMFTIIVLPLLAGLRWIHQYAHNYGYSIIILTFLLSLLLFPFRLKQMMSMKKMQVVQPKVKAIQEKYKRYKKTDPKRTEMNQEIMALYKEHNVNPLGGCLPLVLQFPLLFAFYQLLANSIELRQAPFIGYLHDLSVKDPYYILPIIMGITMFISQKMTPMTPGTDPTQAKMMMVMPVVFTFMFFNVSSGLNLYFLCSNIFQVAFQKIAERWMGDGKSANASNS
jgi:YidC/Oxa1 family membrane protein insertase